MVGENTNFLTTRQLARMWQVSEATVKRWADAGRLHPTRTIGGHRRFALPEVLRFQNEQGLDASRTPKRGLSAGALSKEHEAVDETLTGEQFFEAIVRGREAAATAILLSSYVNGLSLLKILDVSFANAMRRVGKLWHNGEMTVADEHLATQTAARALETLRGCIRLEPPRGRRAIVCAVEEEMHDLAVHCVELLLEEKGWSVINLGAHTPFYAVTDAIEKHSPQLIAISSTVNMALSRNAREYEQFRAVANRSDVIVVLGGEGFRDQNIRQRFPAHLHADSFNDLVEFLQRRDKEP